MRPHLGGDAVLYSVSIGMSVGSLLSGNMKTMDCGEGAMCIDQYQTQQSMWHCKLLLANRMESNNTITTQNSALRN